jgi:hypothetical protein
MEKLTLLDRNERIITPHDRDFMSLPLFDWVCYWKYMFDQK